MGMLSKAKEAAPQEEANVPDTRDSAEVPDAAPEDTEVAGASEAPAVEDEQGAEVDPVEEGGEDDGQGLTPEQEEEFGRAQTALYTVLYQNEKTSRSALELLHPNDKVGSTARTAVMILQQLDKKLQLSNEVLPLVMIVTADRLIEMGTRVKQMAFTPEETKGVLEATMHGAQALFGGGAPQEGAPPQAGAPSPGSVPPGAAAPAPTPGATPQAAPTPEEAA